jgi:hypothetical protein
MFKC